VTLLDGTRPVRAGEELDGEKLRAFLRETLGVDAAPEIEQFPGGHSNLTYLVRAGGRELVLRRPPFGSKVKSAHDMGREYRVLSRLSHVYPKAPRPLAYCDDVSVLGAPFYVMERLRGLVIRRDPPPDLAFTPEVARGLGEAFVDALCELHAVDYAACGLGDLGNPEGYVQRQVGGWTRRYQDARTDAIADMEEVARWLDAHRPAMSAGALIHNDFKYDNLVLDPADPTRIVGVLDWEMSTLGDPLMDLGTSLCYWVQEGDPPDLLAVRFGPTHLPGTPTRREVAERYARKTGRSLDDLPFYYAFGLFKTAVVAQQIYFRFHQGLTKDARFAAMIHGVRALSAQAARVTAGAPV
jgi:aminoglycoside phosphotransferase (APT) family kinase protein